MSILAKATTSTRDIQRGPTGTCARPPRARVRLPLLSYLIPGGRPFAPCSSSLATQCAVGVGSPRQATSRPDLSVGTPLRLQPCEAVESARCQVRAGDGALCIDDEALVFVWGRAQGGWQRTVARTRRES